jgi:hypothetical protein
MWKQVGPLHFLTVAECKTRHNPSTVLEGNARSLGSQDPVDVIAVVELIVITLRHLNNLCGIPILHNDEVVWAQIGPPLLKEVKVPDGGNHYV